MNANCPVAGRIVAEPDSKLRSDSGFVGIAHGKWRTGDSEDEDAKIYC